LTTDAESSGATASWVLLVRTILSLVIGGMLFVVLWACLNYGFGTRRPGRIDDLGFRWPVPKLLCSYGSYTERPIRGGYVTVSAPPARAASVPASPHTVHAAYALTWNRPLRAARWIPTPTVWPLPADAPATRARRRAPGCPKALTSRVSPSATSLTR
jgi:hypothetical protein